MSTTIYRAFVYRSSENFEVYCTTREIAERKLSEYVESYASDWRDYAIYDLGMSENEADQLVEKAKKNPEGQAFERLTGGLSFTRIDVLKLIDE